MASLFKSVATLKQNEKEGEGEEQEKDPKTIVCAFFK